MTLMALDKLTDLGRKFRSLQTGGQPHMDMDADDFIDLVETCETLWEVVRASAKYRSHSSVDCIMSCHCEDELDAAFETLQDIRK